MRVAVVGLNSLFACGATSFMLHLVHESNWDLIVYSETDEETLKDAPVPIGFKSMTRVDSNTVVGIFDKYDAVLLASPRWEGKYEFFNNIVFSHTNVGIVIHDERDFSRMGMHGLIKMLPFAKLFCFDRTVPELFPEYRFHVIKHPYNMNLINFDNADSEGEFLMCATRVSPSKNIDKVIRCAGKYPLHIFGVDSNGDLNLNFGNNVSIHHGVYTFERIASAYASAIAVLDASKLITPSKRTQYSFMDAWRFMLPVLCEKEWIGDELIDGVNCLELSEDNVKDIWDSSDNAEDIGINGYLTLLSNHNPEEVRNDIMNYLLNGRRN